MNLVNKHQRMRGKFIYRMLQLSIPESSQRWGKGQIKGKIKQADFSTEHLISDKTDYYLKNLEKKKIWPNNNIYITKLWFKYKNKRQIFFKSFSFSLLFWN